MQIITLEAGTLENTFVFNVGTGYLYAPSSSSNHLKTHAGIDANSCWCITIDSSSAWLKMCRHSATVDNYPFIKVFVDEQRPESWGADARELADILYVANSGKPKLALPFYTIEEMLYDWAFSRFISMYYDFRHKRGDNTLLVHILKCLVSKIWAHNERIYNRFGYSVLNIEKERGTQVSKPEKKRYYLANYKIYRERFTTDCFSDYFQRFGRKIGCWTDGLFVL